MSRIWLNALVTSYGDFRAMNRVLAPRLLYLEEKYRRGRWSMRFSAVLYVLGRAIPPGYTSLRAARDSAWQPGSDPDRIDLRRRRRDRSGRSLRLDRGLSHRVGLRRGSSFSGAERRVSQHLLGG